MLIKNDGLNEDHVQKTFELPESSTMKAELPSLKQSVCIQQRNYSTTSPMPVSSLLTRNTRGNPCTTKEKFEKEDTSSLGLQEMNNFNRKEMALDFA